MSDNGIQLTDQADQTLQDWRTKEKQALELLQIVGELRFDKSVELVLFRQDIYDSRPSELLNKHLYTINYLDSPIEISTTLAVARALNDHSKLPPAKLDIGKLASEWESHGGDINDFLNDKLSDILGKDPRNNNSRDVVLYGLGRIGRLAARRIIATTGKGEQLRLKGIVLRPKLKDPVEEAHKRAALLSDDSIHGLFPGTVEVSEDGSQLIINGNPVQLIYARDPNEVDYTKYGINNAILIDNTGVWRDLKTLSQHLRPGISQVVLTSPGSGIPNIVHGVNHKEIARDDAKVFCAASCTTNAIVPVLKVIDDKFDIQKGHVETIHSYTSDQNLLDNFHKKPRRGRAAAINMVLTNTGAAEAVAKVLPQLAGKLTGNAVRVPTPNVSLAILALTVDKPTTAEEVNKTIREASLYGDLVEQLHYSTSEEYVSSNAVGMTSTSVIDAPSTIVSDDGKNIIVYAWYDNEFGYTCQVVRLVKYAARVRRYSYY